MGAVYYKMIVKRQLATLPKVHPEIKLSLIEISNPKESCLVMNRRFLLEEKDSELVLYWAQAHTPSDLAIFFHEVGHLLLRHMFRQVRYKNGQIIRHVPKVRDAAQKLQDEIRASEYAIIMLDGFGLLSNQVISDLQDGLASYTTSYQLNLEKAKRNFSFLYPTQTKINPQIV